MNETAIEAKALVLEPDPVPLDIDEDGVARVGGTRVTLDTVIGSFERGASAEEVALRYSALRLADVYSVIGYYLHHKAEIDAYLNRERALDEQARKDDEVRYNLVGIRERLLARRAASGH